MNHYVYVSSHETPNSFEYVTHHGLIACCWVKTVLDNPKDIPNIQEYLQMRLNEDA
ncbi:hypothetical protein [Bacillus pseudomycoides]|uniref:hypothetical protein n=1 Tax=Bacillus pseudomycoides TaxID=64104 RepID=UPI00159667A3|nr:hypothetical protein [Bacillus pseudomycoides]